MLAIDSSFVFAAIFFKFCSENIFNLGEDFCLDKDNFSVDACYYLYACWFEIVLTCGLYLEIRENTESDAFNITEDLTAFGRIEL